MAAKCGRRRYASLRSGSELAVLRCAVGARAACSGKVVEWHWDGPARKHRRRPASPLYVPGRAAAGAPRQIVLVALLSFLTLTAVLPPGSGQVLIPRSAPFWRAGVRMAGSRLSWEVGRLGLEEAGRVIAPRLVSTPTAFYTLNRQNDQLENSGRTAVGVLGDHGEREQDLTFRGGCRRAPAELVIELEASPPVTPG